MKFELNTNSMFETQPGYNILQVSAVAMETISQSFHSYAVLQNICTLFTCLTCLAVKIVSAFCKN